MYNTLTGDVVLYAGMKDTLAWQAHSWNALTSFKIISEKGVIAAFSKKAGQSQTGDKRRGILKSKENDNGSEITLT